MQAEFAREGSESSLYSSFLLAAILWIELHFPKTLRRVLPGKGQGSGLGKFEADEPVTGDAVTIHFRRGECPPASSLHREIGEILARTGGIEFGLRNISSGLDMDADGDTNFALNRVASFFGNVGQDLV